MPQIFSRKADTLMRTGLLAVVVGLVSLPFTAGLIVRSDYVTEVNQSLRQPVPFSHQHHVGGLGIDCRYCHNSVETSPVAGLPPTETCMTCHSQIWTNAEMLEPVRQSLARGRPLRWQRVYDLPDFVYFNHAVHVNNGIGCETCHGRVDRMPLTKKVRPFYMRECLECHREPRPNLRPPEAITAMGWTPPADDPEPGERLFHSYAIRNENLTDCSICHR